MSFVPRHCVGSWFCMKPGFCELLCCAELCPVVTGLGDCCCANAGTASTVASAVAVIVCLNMKPPSYCGENAAARSTRKDARPKQNAGQGPRVPRMDECLCAAACRAANARYAFALASTTVMDSDSSP